LCAASAQSIIIFSWRWINIFSLVLPIYEEFLFVCDNEFVVRIYFYISIIPKKLLNHVTCRFQMCVSDSGWAQLYSRMKLELLLICPVKKLQEPQDPSQSSISRAVFFSQASVLIWRKIIGLSFGTDSTYFLPYLMTYKQCRLALLISAEQFTS
jgi:hypothetical protein